MNGLVNDDWASMTRFEKHLVGHEITQETQTTLRDLEEGLETQKEVYEIARKAGQENVPTFGADEQEEWVERKAAEAGLPEVAEEWKFAQRPLYGRLRELPVFTSLRSEWDEVQYEGQTVVELAEGFWEQWNHPDATSTYRQELGATWENAITTAIAPELINAARGLPDDTDPSEQQVIPQILMKQGGISTLEDWFK